MKLAVLERILKPRTMKHILESIICITKNKYIYSLCQETNSGYIKMFNSNDLLLPSRFIFI